MRVLLTVALLLAAPPTASAEIFAVPFAGIKFGGGTSIVDLELAQAKKKFTMGAAVMNIEEGVLGYEVSFSYIPGYLEARRCATAAGEDGQLPDRFRRAV